MLLHTYCLTSIPSQTRAAVPLILYDYMKNRGKNFLNIFVGWNYNHVLLYGTYFKIHGHGDGVQSRLACCQGEDREQEPLGRAEEAEGDGDGDHEDAAPSGHGGGGNASGE